MTVPGAQLQLSREDSGAQAEDAAVMLGRVNGASVVVAVVVTAAVVVRWVVEAGVVAEGVLVAGAAVLCTAPQLQDTGQPLVSVA